MRRYVVFLISIVYLLGVWIRGIDDKVIVFDVGQGDSIFITAGGRNVLIDGGPDKEVLFALGEYMLPWDKEIDIVVLTHPHADHINGLVWVGENFEVDHILYSGVEFENKAYRLWLENGQGLFQQVLASKRVLLPNDFMLTIIPSPLGINMDNINNSSLVVKLENSETNFLFMGDAEKEEERSLLDRGLLSDTTILKAGHHCSKTSSSEAFLKKVNPQVAICSLGVDNPYNHPSEETLQRFNAMGIRYLITRDDGDIVFDL